MIQSLVATDKPSVSAESLGLVVSSLLFLAFRLWKSRIFHCILLLSSAKFCRSIIYNWRIIERVHLDLAYTKRKMHFLFFFFFLSPFISPKPSSTSNHPPYSHNHHSVVYVHEFLNRYLLICGPRYLSGHGS